MTHTPGPWMKPKNESEVMTSPQGIIKICKLYPIHDGDLTGEANGQLIACAPDMLTRLQTNYDMMFKLYEMVNHHSNEEVLKQIRTELYETLELIKKAQGAN